MSQQRSTRALPTSRPTFPATSSRENKPLANVYKKNAFSLDGRLRTSSARVAAPLASTLGPLAEEGTAATHRGALSPVEELMATAGALPGVTLAPSLPSSHAGGEGWRSQLLRCETELRELVTRGVHEPPSLDRTLKVVDLFDRVSCALQAQPSNVHVGDLLRLFRVEFCRSIFAASDCDDAARDDDDTASAATGAQPNEQVGISGSTPRKSKGSSDGCLEIQMARAYFDEAASLGRAKAVLATALSKGTSGEAVLLLERSLEEKSEQIMWYETELERVRRQFDQATNECRRLRQKVEMDAQEAASIQCRLQRDIQTLRIENKDAQLQLFRLRKQMAGGKSNQLKEGYQQLKLSKIAQTQSLFDEGDERVALLVLLEQVESRVNEVLDVYDNEFVLTAEGSRRDLRKKMAESVVVLLEDMHFCEEAYRRLVATHRTGGKKMSATTGNDTNQADSHRIPLELVHSGKQEEAPDETDGFVAILFDRRVYEHFKARHTLQRRLQKYQASINANDSQTKVARPGKVSLSGSMYADAPFLPAERQTTMSPETQSSQAGGSLPGQALSREEHSCTLASPTTERPDDPLSVIKIGLLDSCHARHAANLSPLSKTSDSCPKPSSPTAAALTQGSGPLATALPQLPATRRMRTLQRVDKARRAEWVENILGPSTASVAFTIPRPNSEQADVVVVQRMMPEVLPAEAVMRRVLRRPLQDLNSDRFLSTIEVYTGEDPVQQKLLCRMNHVDPSLPIQVPEATNYLKIKYAHAENAHGTHASVPGKRGSMASQCASESHCGGAGGDSTVYRGNPNLQLFKELGSKSLVENNPGLQYRAGAVSSTTASTVAFQRLNPLSPDRAPEWLLYKELFGAFRSLTPRMIEVTTIDHLMACASERFFIRMEYRYEECLTRAAQQCTNLQLRQDMAARLFKEMYVLSDFQEALVDELEVRYGYPELVAKTLYEILCYLDAVVEKDKVLAAYLDVIRGFVSPTQVHFVSYMLYHLSHCWPSADPNAPVSDTEARTVFDYLYRNASPLFLIDPENIFKDYNTASRSTPLTFMSLRHFLATSMVHMEEPLLLFLHGRFHGYTQRRTTDEITWDTFSTVMMNCGRIKEERRSLVRFLASGLGVNRPAFASLQQLTFLAASAWCSNLWE
ncbi:hypothetical protein LSCM1_01050 [Leishmania martiniquensis]|uniref:Uncharacterized protein n=1 Tax=Leishmania martiniquensis TaxID=1580590 RepID=A0A836GYZ8_9TRYP|nr:hypothetical protein LSCM1_01050 [Leishmania martiniquensis]